MSRVFITFDDGRKDNYEKAYHLLNKLGLKATFFVTAGFIDGSFKTDDFGKGRLPLSLEELAEMKASGMEIGSHGDRHVTDANDFDVAFGKLASWGLIGKRCSFSLPRSIEDKTTFPAFLNHCAPMLSNVRGGRDSTCYSFLRKLAFLSLRIKQTYPAYSYFNKPNVLHPGERRCAYPSIVVRKEDKVPLLCRFLNDLPPCSEVILMFHSIVDEPSTTWEWSTNNFADLCGFLNKSKIETPLFSEL